MLIQPFFIFKSPSDINLPLVQCIIIFLGSIKYKKYKTQHTHRFIYKDIIRMQKMKIVLKSNMRISCNTANKIIEDIKKTPPKISLNNMKQARMFECKSFTEFSFLTRELSDTHTHTHKVTRDRSDTSLFRTNKDYTGLPSE